MEARSMEGVVEEESSEIEKVDAETNSGTHVSKIMSALFSKVVVLRFVLFC